VGPEPHPSRQARPSPSGSYSLPVVAGSQAAIDRLNEFLFIYDTNWNPVIILGGGKVGTGRGPGAQAARACPCTWSSATPRSRTRIGDLPDRLVIGDAADRDVMREVGIEDAPSVLLTTNRDEANIFLARTPDGSAPKRRSSAGSPTSAISRPSSGRAPI
jgi:voltage-gated potassium channel Kch